jgi:hypothetical protein
MEHLPIWFLILALILPRVTLAIAYFSGTLQPYHLSGWIPPALALLVPRALVLILIFQDRGFSVWLLIHAIVMSAVYIGTARQSRSSH